MSPFLSFILFCFLLFLETVTEEQKTYRNLDSGITLFRANLFWLCEKIPPPDENLAFCTIQQRIEDFINKVNMYGNSLRSKGEHSVKKDIRITEGVDNISASINAFQQSSQDRTPEAFNELLDKIGTIWDAEVKPHIDKAVK